MLMMSLGAVSPISGRCASTSPLVGMQLSPDPSSSCKVSLTLLPPTLSSPTPPPTVPITL
ncbi:hypothetical protein BHE74_00035862 [Ensete ventricosum]|uniref:Uncharacterized protein n=1 Tax=Ensete ventricosum TaxID=4639 RepID=A0A426Z596_ENSVE|nr:hypothetical protein B296_00041602 [Ensete ventricosum]RWW04934.1 hypothetical protein GW17_00031819 [Ensete ventricosum]RWW57356.1 hypothetical protein BHE74_00035862 [Ensete ventricosum]RZR82406.1 hypothetical protein BHM03_00008806 [Ensete ventricosum]